MINSKLSMIIMAIIAANYTPAYSSSECDRPLGDWNEAEWIIFENNTVITFDDLKNKYGWNGRLTFYAWGEELGAITNQNTTVGLGMASAIKGIKVDVPKEGYVNADWYYKNICLGNLKFSSTTKRDGGNEKLVGALRVEHEGVRVTEGLKIYYFSD